jgi:hypothetical protein
LLSLTVQLYGEMHSASSLHSGQLALPTGPVQSSTEFSSASLRGVAASAMINPAAALSTLAAARSSGATPRAATAATVVITSTSAARAPSASPRATGAASAASASAAAARASGASPRASAAHTSAARNNRMPRRARRECVCARQSAARGKCARGNVDLSNAVECRRMVTAPRARRFPRTYFSRP